MKNLLKIDCNSNNAGKEFVKSLSETGFAVIINHGINSDLISDRLENSYLGNPDLLIRTGGESRVSDFLLWQIAYSEIYFTDIYWPDFDELELDKAIEDYQSRERKFGRVNADA